jgi:membrane-bound lytic murein transglycosylase C
MKKVWLALGVVLLLSAAVSTRAQENFDAAFDELERAFEETATGEEEAWDKGDAIIEAQWEEQVKQTEAEWERLRAQVERKWDEFFYSTNREWVDYDEGKDTRSRVNFEAGEIEVSTLVPVEEVVKPEPVKKKPAPPEPVKLAPEQKKQVKAQAEKKIAKQIKKIFSAENEVKSEVLAGQVKDPEGQPVTPQNVTRYVKKHVTPKIVVEDKPVVGKDGKQRIKVTARIKMIPEHLEIRAGKFKPQVKKYADKYNLDPALVFAVIHTESYFNPLAKSWVPAYGLMQLVPRYGAMEAYHYLYNEKKLLPADYLYNPDNNIMLGATYLHLLDAKYFGGVKNKANRQSLCIAAYNSGPTRLKKKVVSKYDVDNMDNGEFVEVIRKVVPEETKSYILKVQKRVALYEGMI